MLKISIIVPVYNTEKYLKECLDSLINQTYSNIEIIIINDGSTDNSLDIIKEYANMFKNIKYYNQENQGLFITRKNGVKYATGDYIMFVDSDDWIDIDTVDNLVNLINKYHSEVIKFRYIIEPNKNIQAPIIPEIVNYPYNVTNKKMIYQLFIEKSVFNNLANEIIKKELINYKEFENIGNLCQAEDALLNFEIFTIAKKILIIDNCYYHYRQNENSLTHLVIGFNIKKSIEDTLKVFEMKIKYVNIWKCNNIENEKILAKELLDFIVQQLIRLSNVENSQSDIYNQIYNLVYENNTYKKLISKLELPEIKDKNIIKRRIKINFVKKNRNKLKKYIKLVSIILKFRSKFKFKIK